MFPHEFLIAFRLVQLIKLRDGYMAPFFSEIEDLLQQITGYRSSFTFTDAENTIVELAGANFPWRSGLAPLNTFRVSQIPLRRSHLKPFMRNTLSELCGGLISLITEYEGLPLWQDEVQPQDEESGLSDKPALKKQDIDNASARRNILLAVVFNYLGFYHPKSVTIEDSPGGLTARLGITIEWLESLKHKVQNIEGFDTNPRNMKQPSDAAFKFHIMSKQQSLVILMVEHDEREVAFVGLDGEWLLWTNAWKDSIHVLTKCDMVLRYFDFHQGQKVQ